MNVNYFKSFIRLITLFLIVLNFPRVLGATEEFRIPMLTDSIVLDGKLDELVWQNALQINLDLEVSPGENIPAQVKTQAFIFEDGNNLIIAFEAKDNSTGDIRAYLSDRDNIDTSDRVGIKLDTFNNSRSAFEFYVNPLGIQMDSIVDERTGKTDESWDAIWESHGSITDLGFIVEMVIPFKALRFEDGEREKTWGIELARFWPRNVEHVFSNQTLNRNLACKLCQMLKAKGFKNAQSPTNLTLIPAVTIVQSEARDINPRSAWEGEAVDASGSLDLRYGITQNAYLNATINPDFSQIEADALQLDVNSLSSLFLNEKRAFFLDGSDYFNNWSRLVYTRIFNEPNYGLKLTAKQGGHSYGFMAIEDQNTNFLIPYEYGTRLVRLDSKTSQNQLFRYRYDIDDTGNIGTTLTHRQAQGYENSMASVDGKFWVNESNFFRFQMMGSESDYPDEILTRSDIAKEKISGKAASMNFTHNSRNWDGFLTFHHFDEDFRADTGFVNFGNWKRKAIGGSRTWFATEESSWWKAIKLYSDWVHSEEIDGTDIDKGYRWQLEFKAIFEASFGIDFEDKTRTFIDSGLTLQDQTEFEQVYTTLWGQFKPLANLGITLEFSKGDEIDYSTASPADGEVLFAEIDFQVLTRLNVQIEHIHQTLDSNVAGVFKIDLTNFRLAYQINRDSFIRLVLQSQVLNLNDSLSSDEFLASQLIYSYEINPFTLFYLGYSDQYFTEITTSDLVKSDKTIFLKFSYAWQL